METASLFTQKVGKVLSGAISHMTKSDASKAPYTKGRSEDIN